VLWNFDQCPFHMNESGSKALGTLHFRGSCSVPLKEGHSATRERWTVSTMVSSEWASGRGGGPEGGRGGGLSSGGVGESSSRGGGLLASPGPRPLPPLELMFKAKGHTLEDRLQAHIPAWAPWLTVATSASGSYKEHNLLDYLDKVLPPLTAERGWRILLCDAYRPHMAQSLRRLAWERGFVVVWHGGGATPVCQANDTDLHHTLRQKYTEIEQGWMLREQALDAHKCPVPKKEDCMQWIAEVWSDPALHRRGGGGFAATGLSNALSGAEDCMIVREALTFWKALDMPRWRQAAVHDVQVEASSGRLRWTYDDVASLIVDFPAAAARWAEQRDDDGDDVASGVVTSDSAADDGPDSDGWGGSDGADSDGGRGVSSPPGSPDAAVAVSSAHAAVAASGVDAAAGEAWEKGRMLREAKAALETSGEPRVVSALNRAIHTHEKTQRLLGRMQAAVAAGLSGPLEDPILVEKRALLREEQQAEKRRRATLAELSAQAEHLVQARRRLEEARARQESLAAVRSFDLAELGQGMARGGGRAHAAARGEVLDRIRLRSPLPPDLSNDWSRFKREWDRCRVGVLPDGGTSWAARFKDIAVGLLERINAGEADVLASWMRQQTARYLPHPDLRV